MVSKQSILGYNNVNLIDTYEEMRKMIASSEWFYSNQVNPNFYTTQLYQPPAPPPAPPHPQLHPFYTSEFSSPSWFHNYNNFQYTAPHVFDEIAVRNPTHTPAIYTSPYTLTVQTTLSTGQSYFAIEPQMFDGSSVENFVATRTLVGEDVCETDAKLESTIESAVKSDFEEINKLEARVVCEGVPKSRLLMEDELGVEIEDMSIYETSGDMCEIDHGTETEEEVGCVDEAKNEGETNVEKLMPPLLHLSFQVASTNENAQKLIDIADTLNESVGDGKVVDINPELLRQFSFGARALLNHVAAMFGGIVSQEVMKACPVFGAKLLKKFEDAQVFIIGSGALGCKFLKSLALMGVLCSKQEKLTVTDDDDWNIGQAKSMVDATTTAMIDLALRIEALQNRGGLEIEKVFNDSFWENHSVVVNAYLSNTSEYTSAILNARIFEWKNNDVIVFFVEAISKQEIVIRPYWNGLTYLLLNAAQAAALDLGFVSELIAQGQARDRDWKSAPGLKPKSSLEIQQYTLRTLFDTGWNQVMQDYCFDGASAVPVISKASMIIIGMNLNAGGSVHGLLLKKGFAGLSGAILSQIYVLINSPDSASLIFMVAVGPAMVVISLMFIVRPVGGHRQVRSSDGASSSFIYCVCLILTAYLMGVMLVEDLMDLNHIVIIIFTVVLFIILLVPIVTPIWLMFTQEPEDQAREALLTAPCREEPVITGHDVNEIIFSEVEDEKPRGVDLLPATERHKRIAQLQAKLAQAAAEGAVRVKSRRVGPRRGEDFTLVQALIKADFWLIFFSLLLGMKEIRKNQAQKNNMSSYVSAKIIILEDKDVLKRRTM